MNRWKRKAKALARLAEDQRGKPEGDLAREKLVEILRDHPEARTYSPIVELAKRDITLKDLGNLKKAGFDITGHWEGATPAEAFAAMMDHYRELMARAFGVPKEFLDAEETSKATYNAAAARLGADDDEH